MPFKESIELKTDKAWGKSASSSQYLSVKPKGYQSLKREVIHISKDMHLYVMTDISFLTDLF